MGTSKNLLRDPIAALGGTRSLAYLLDMSRLLRSVRLALGPLVTVFRGPLMPVSLLLIFMVSMFLLSACAPIPCCSPPPEEMKWLGKDGTVEALIPSERRYRFEEVSILVEVRKEGRLARLGHNHIVSIQQTDIGVADRPLEGDGLTGARVVMALRVADFVVDDPELRAKSGEGFHTKLTDKDRIGTRVNMLSPSVLDAQRYPIITIEGTVMDVLENKLRLLLEFNIRGVSHRQVVEADVLAEKDRVTLSGDLKLLHKDFGLKPFSALFGALRVSEELAVQYRLVLIKDGS